jgi:tetratricopeptide (TPR) repeat protein
MVPSASSPTADAPLLEQALAQAASAYDANNWPHAERLCRLILGTAANHAPALNLLGLIAAQSDRLHEAVALFRQSAASNPRDPFVHSNLGNALRGIGDSSGAINSYAVAIALDPDNPSAHNNLAAALADLGRYEAALSSLDQALRVCPDSLDAGG